MTPKELLEAHGGDPLAAVENFGKARTLIAEIVWPRIHVNRYAIPEMSTLVKSTIAHLGEDGAERWGRALFFCTKWADVTDKTLFTSFAEYCGYLKLMFETAELGKFERITRIANASDRERLAACLAALAEVEK